jgi:hypothetical protein
MSDLGIGTGGQAGADQWSGQQKQDPYILYLCVPNLPFLRSKQVGRWLCGSRGLCNDRSARRGKQRSDRGCHEARPARYTKSHAGSSKQPALLLCFIRTILLELRRGHCAEAVGYVGCHRMLTFSGGCLLQPGVRHFARRD